MREVFKVMFPFQGINSFQKKKKKKEILKILKEIHGINLYSWGLRSMDKLLYVKFFMV